MTMLVVILFSLIVHNHAPGNGLYWCWLKTNLSPTVLGFFLQHLTNGRFSFLIKLWAKLLGYSFFISFDKISFLFLDQLVSLFNFIFS